MWLELIGDRDASILSRETMTGHLGIAELNPLEPRPFIEILSTTSGMPISTALGWFLTKLPLLGSTTLDLLPLGRIRTGSRFFS